ncbi:MAG: hypothetical protein EOM54_11125 [Clostridia bacterium]|nr:hypothetical protein [Clostridia bacterium]
MKSRWYYMDLLSLYEKTFNALSKGGFQSIIEAAYESMQTPIYLHDSAFNMLAAAPMEKIGDYFWDLSLELGHFPRDIIMLFYDQGYMQAASESKEPYYVDWGDCAERPRIQGVVRVNNVVEGYITIFCPKEICTPDHLRATKLIVNACEIEMERSKSRNISENPLFKVFMHDLIKGQIHTKEILDMWLQRLPPSFHGAFQLYVIKYPGGNLKAVQKYLFDLLKRAHSRHTEIIDDDMFYLLLYSLEPKDTFDLMRNEVQKSLETLRAHAGISDRFSDIIKFDVFREQAKAALEIGEFLDPENGLYHYRDYRFPFILHAVATNMEEENVMAPGIGELAQYDKKYKTAYLDTLEQYVLENRNSKNTIENLGIHRNTLLYRLQKIEELLSISLDDGSTFAHYYISFYIRKMKGDSLKKSAAGLPSGSADV